MLSKSLLEILINIFYYLLLLIGVGIVAEIFYLLLFDDGYGIVVHPTTGVLLNEHIDASLGFKDYLKIIITLAEMVFFIKAIYHLRKATLVMINADMFSEMVSKHLKLTGISIILYKALSIGRTVYSEFVYQGTFTIGLDFHGFESSIFLLILGLFFILLSGVISSGNQLKSENELTI